MADIHFGAGKSGGELPGVEDGMYAHLVPAMMRTSRDYLRRQWCADEIYATQTERLVHCLTDAVRSVPAYRVTGIGADDIARDPRKCLAQFPHVEKHQIRDALEDFVADDFIAEQCIRLLTSGSTGIPLTLLHDDENQLQEAASFYRLLDAVGFEAGEKICRVFSDCSRPMWGTTVQLLPGQIELAALNLLDIHHAWGREYVTRLRDWQPIGLSGNPSDLLALSLLAEDMRIAFPSVRFIVAAGENLLPNARATIESIFRCKVHDVYSLQELRGVAWECEAGTLHVNEDRVIVESLDSGECGAPELLITCLTNRSMPLIRYRTRDLGHFVAWHESPCSCGRQLGRIEDFTGRDRGFIVFDDGRVCGPKPVKMVLTDKPVAAWQLIQKKAGHLDVLVVPRPGVCSSSILSDIEEEITRLLDNHVTVDARWVQPEELLHGPGKFQMMHLMSNGLKVSAA
jgi:phenylacetate-CoA ligase